MKYWGGALLFFGPGSGRGPVRGRRRGGRATILTSISAWGGMSENGYQQGNEARWIRRLAGYCWRFKRDVTIALIGALLYTAATLSIPLLQRAVIDNVIVQHTESVWPLAFGLLIAAVANFFGVYMRRYRGGKMALHAPPSMRPELFDSLSNLDGARQDEIHTGQLVGRSISDINMVQGLLQWMPLILGSSILFVFSLVIMIILSPQLSLVAIAVAAALWLIATASRKKPFPASWQAQQVVGDVAGIVDESIGGVRVVKGFGQEEQEMERMEGASRSLFGSRLRMIRLTARYNPALTAIPSFGLVGVLLLGGWLAIRGNITLGTFLAFSSYLAQLAGPVRVLTNLVTIGQEARASVIRVFEVIDSKPTITDKPDAIELPADANGIMFDDVQFGYVPSQPVLRGLTLEVRPGETVAVIGLGQVPPQPAPPPLLRRARRRGADRGARRPRRHRAVASGLDRHGDGGVVPLLRLGQGQHRLRPAGRHR